MPPATGMVGSIPGALAGPKPGITVDRKLSVDLLKIVMALCVVAIHVNPLHDTADGGAFLTGGIARVAVPVFFLINGYYFEPVAHQRGAGSYATRLLWLFAVWTALYLPAWSWALSHPDLWPLARFAVMGWWHLWYLPGLALAAVLAVQMLTWPLPRQLVVVATSFLVGVGIVYGLAFEVLTPSGLIFGDMTILHRNGLFLGLPFLMAGMLIRRYGLERWFTLRVLSILVVLALALVVGEGALLRQTATGVANHDNLLTLGIASPLVFLFALKFDVQSRTRHLGTYANGLFFVHVAFCVVGFRLTEMAHLWIFCMAVSGSVLVTSGMIRTGLARRLL